MEQLTIFHYLDIREDELYKRLSKLTTNEQYSFEFGQVIKNEVGLLEVKNNQLEKAFTKLIDCYFFVLELENKK